MLPEQTLTNENRSLSHIHMRGTVNYRDLCDQNTTVKKNKIWSHLKISNKYMVKKKCLGDHM